MGIFNDLLKFASTVIGTIVDVIVETGFEIASQVREHYKNFQDRSRHLDIERSKKANFKRLHEINGEIVDLERKKACDSRLGSHDQDRFNELTQLRENARGDLYTTQEAEAAKIIVDGQGHFDTLKVWDENTQVLQFHVGQTIFGKRCTACARPMQLQWRQNILNVSMGDFFWGCTGYFSGSCRKTEYFNRTDMTLFTRVDRPEFELSANQFNKMILLPGSTREVNRRVRELKNEPCDIYLCPEHHVEMMLKEKKDANGLLDQYFLGCPFWKPRNAGCGQVVKLKSAAQLASLLEKQTGRGIL